MSAEQKNPYLAAPEDFPITRDDDQVFTGQASDKLLKQADAECERRLTKRTPATETSAAKAPHTK
jgi:hypothetical protein